MSTKTPNDRVCIRPSPEARHAIQTILVALQAPSKFGPDLTQEDLVSATWLWMAGRIDQVGKGIPNHLEAVRAWRLQSKQSVDLPPAIVDQSTPQEQAAIEAKIAKPKKRRKG